MSNFNKNFTPHFYFIYLQRIMNSWSKLKNNVSLVI